MIEMLILIPAPVKKLDLSNRYIPRQDAIGVPVIYDTMTHTYYFWPPNLNNNNSPNWKYYDNLIQGTSQGRLVRPTKQIAKPTKMLFRT